MPTIKPTHGITAQIDDRPRIKLPKAPASVSASLEAERAVLGAILYDNAVYGQVTERLKALDARHFYEPFHSHLYAAMEERIRNGELAEPIVIMERFRRDPVFEDLGGLRYLADLIDRAPPVAQALEYAHIIYELAVRREVIRVEGEVAANLADAREQLATARRERARLHMEALKTNCGNTTSDAAAALNEYELAEESNIGAWFGIAEFMDSRGYVDAVRVAEVFRMSQAQLAETLGLGREALSKETRRYAPKTQGRLTEALEIIARVAEWAGGRPQAMAWYRTQPLPALNGRTPEALVRSGQAGAVREYLDHLVLGGFA